MLSLQKNSCLSFARTLARFPFVVLIVSGCLCVALTLIGFLATDWPDFSNPILGFNTTGTDISNKLLALHNLQNEIGVGKAYYQFPSEIPKRPKSGARKETKKAKKRYNESEIFLDNRLTERFNCHSGQCNRTDANEMEDPSYCRINFSNHYAHLVFEIDEIGSYDVFTKLCQAEEKLWRSSWNIQLIKRDNCAVHSQGSCCQPWHLGSIAASLFNKQHCSDLNATDFENFKSILSYCSSHKKFILNCWESDAWDSCSKGRIPLNCSSQDFYFLYNFILPKNFNNLSFSNDHDSPTYTLMMLPVAKQSFENDDDADSQMIKNLQKEFYKIDELRLVAMDLGLRDMMFMDYLLMDTIYGALAIIFVLLSMWFYTGSLAFTCASVVGILMSMGVAYFIYRIIFINFFPFMNLLTFVLMVGLGADDTFIYRSAWTRAKSKKHAGTLPKVVSDTLAHAAVAMFVTSLTTSAAFFSNFLSSIIVVKCFGVFAGITVLTNYVVVITWLPAAVILIEKYDCSMTNGFHSCSRVERKNRHTFTEDIDNNQTTEIYVPSKMGAGIWCLVCWSPIVRCYHNCVDIGKVFIEKLLPWLVIKFRYIWIFGLGSLSIVAAIAVFHYPGLRLPDKDYFQYFKRRHPFERWESELKEKFMFSSKLNQIPMLSTIVWGVNPTVDAQYLNPHDHGTLNVWSNNTFEFNSNLALVWLREFCSKMAVENFTLYEPPMIAYCFVHDFMTWMNGPCIEPDKKNRTPCCNENPFPYPPNVFDVCLKRAMTKFPNDIQRSLMFTGLRNGPFFSSVSQEFSLLTIAFPSKYNFTLSFQEMDEYYTTVNGFVVDQLTKGPSMVRRGWFISEQLQFYDLQKALLNGTQISVAVAVAIAFGVLFLTTLNPLISLLAIISISSVIFTTIACLILLDWELNVLESTVIILTIGLSFDFTLHYGVSYKLGTEIDREARVVCILSWTGGPVFMAMITTFLAGLAMMPSTTMAYFQIGLFMMIVTLISWIYSTFFFCSLLYVVGPTGDQCQFRWSSIFSRRHRRTTTTTRKFSKDMTGRKMSITRHISSNLNSPGKIAVSGEYSSDIVELEPIFNEDRKETKPLSFNRRNIKERSAMSIRRASMPVIRGIPTFVEQTNNGDTRHKFLHKRMQSDLTTNRVAIACNRV